ncbi:MAG: asparaginase domain-containing protein [bacterium]|nr:asparaginase domain-containing protein [bacterium]
MAIKLFITGGTIDCEKLDPSTEKYIFSETHLPEMLKQAKNRIGIKLEVLMLKDSIYMTDSDREKILQGCKSCKEDKIIITHGTDTMVETAQVLGKSIKDKTIVLLGAMIPYNQKNSDASFNLGSAITAVQLLPKGVYITMNGKIFSWDNVRKNKELQEFEELD